MFFLLLLFGWLGFVGWLVSGVFLMFFFVCVSFGFFCLVVFCLVVCGVSFVCFLGFFWWWLLFVWFLVHYTAGLCSSLTPQGSTTIHIINN